MDFTLLNKMQARSCFRLTATVLVSALWACVAQAELYINELYWDPPSKPDSPREYIELRGTPGMSLANHYLMFIENEDNLDHSGNTGTIETFFDLNGRTIGSNGFLTLRQKSSPFAVDPAANNLINTGLGSGWGASSASSSIGAWDQGGEGEIENSGFTAMLIRNDGAAIVPQQLLGQDLDVGNDGLDNLVTSGPDWQIVNPSINRNWTILDSIGVFGEEGEAGLGRTYAKINFGQEIPGQPLSPSRGGVDDGNGNFVFVPNIEPGATYVGVGYEIELAARWGNSTGQTAADWHVTNVTNNVASGSRSGTDLRQSCIDGIGCHPANDGNVNTPPPLGLPTESNQGVPYGTQLTNTLGRPNFLLGDFNKDGQVDAADYTVWRDTLSQTGSDLGDHPADANHNYVVDDADYALWKAHFGEPRSFGAGVGSGAASVGPQHVPEPASLVSLAVATLTLAAFRRRNPVPFSSQETN